MINLARNLFRAASAADAICIHQQYRIYPRIGRTFFKEKKRSKFEVQLIRGYKSFELINMQHFPTHTVSTKLLDA